MISHDILILFALESETAGLFQEKNVIYSGVGKVNAAYGLTKTLAQRRQLHGNSPKLILNLGSAGSTQFKTGSLVNCTSFVQRDFDVSALGHEMYVTPYESIPAVLDGGLRYTDYVEGICGTGDSFVSDGKKTLWNVVDMEAYAFAKVCRNEQIPFGCIKYVTDGADSDAASSWESRLAEAAKALRLVADAINVTA